MGNATRNEQSTAPESAPEFGRTNLKRRRFLFTLGAGGAGAAVVVAGTLPGAAAAQAFTAQNVDAEPGYRETEHVRDYYRTAKI